MSLVNVQFGDKRHVVCVEVDDGFEVFQFQAYSLTDIPPNLQEYRVCNESQLSDANSGDFASIFDIRSIQSSDVVIIRKQNPQSSQPTTQSFPMGSAASTTNAPQDYMVQMLQQQEQQKFIARLKPNIHQVELYEDEQLQVAARQIIPIAVLQKRAQEALDSGTSHFSYADQYVKELLYWFKHEFFKWVNNAPCDRCSSTKTRSIGPGQATPEERRGLPGRIELYQCQCGHVTRFPRYNHPLKLLETRRGRCGEWANCFTFCLRSSIITDESTKESIVFDKIRYIHDFTDHVWTEYWSTDQHKWVHCDPCENAYDAPLMYEKGWGKKINYIIAFSHYGGVIDVTQRYTHNWRELCKRRQMVSEEWLASYVKELQLTFQMRYSLLLRKEIQMRLDTEKKLFQRNLEIDLYDLDVSYKAEESIGRLTGSIEWRKIRGEIGDLSERKDDSNEQSGSVDDIAAMINPTLLDYTETRKPEFTAITDIITEKLITFDFTQYWVAYGGLPLSRLDCSGRLASITVEINSNNGYIIGLSCEYELITSPDTVERRSTPVIRCGKADTFKDTSQQTLQLSENEYITRIDQCRLDTDGKVVQLSVYTTLSPEKPHILGDTPTQAHTIFRLQPSKELTIVSIAGRMDDNGLTHINCKAAPFGVTQWLPIVSKLKEHAEKDMTSYGRAHKLLKMILFNMSKRSSKFHTLKCSNKKLSTTVLSYDWCTDILRSVGWHLSTPDTPTPAIITTEDDEKKEPSSVTSTSIPTTVTSTDEACWKVMDWKGFSRVILKFAMDLLNTFAPMPEELELDIKSYANEDPIGARTSWIKINGDDYRQPGRGHGIVALNLNEYTARLRNGERFLDISRHCISHQRTFDTFGDDKSGTQMAHFLQAIPLGYIVIVCVHDSAENHFHPAMQQLELLGIPLPSQLKVLSNRESLVILGRKHPTIVGDLAFQWMAAMKQPKGNGPTRIKTKINLPELVDATSIPIQPQSMKLPIRRVTHFTPVAYFDSGDNPSPNYVFWKPILHQERLEFELGHFITGNTESPTLSFPVLSFDSVDETTLQTCIAKPVKLVSVSMIESINDSSKSRFIIFRAIPPHGFHSLGDIAVQWSVIDGLKHSLENLSANEISKPDVIAKIAPNFRCVARQFVTFANAAIVDRYATIPRLFGVPSSKRNDVDSLRQIYVWNSAPQQITDKTTHFVVTPMIATSSIAAPNVKPILSTNHTSAIELETESKSDENISFTDLSSIKHLLHPSNDAPIATDATTDAPKAVPSPQASKQALVRAQIARRVKLYYGQLMNGCGDPMCGNKYCASNRDFKPVTNAEAGKMSVQLTRQFRDQYLCKKP